MEDIHLTRQTERFDQFRQKCQADYDRKLTELGDSVPF